MSSEHPPPIAGPRNKADLLVIGSNAKGPDPMADEIPPGVMDGTPPATPAQAAQDISSGSDLLRSLSLAGEPAVLEADPREQYPGLQLTGRIISAAFCIPYKVNYRPGGDWVWNQPSSPYINSLLVLSDWWLGIETPFGDVRAV